MEPGSNHIHKHASGTPSLKRRSVAHGALLDCSFRIALSELLLQKKCWSAQGRSQKRMPSDGKQQHWTATPLTHRNTNTVAVCRHSRRFALKGSAPKQKAECPFIPVLRGGVHEANLTRQQSLARFVNTQSGLGSRARSKLRQSLWSNVEHDWLIGNWFNTLYKSCTHMKSTHISVKHEMDTCLFMLRCSLWNYSACNMHPVTPHTLKFKEAPWKRSSIMLSGFRMRSTAHLSFVSEG